MDGLLLATISVDAQYGSGSLAFHPDGNRLLVGQGPFQPTLLIDIGRETRSPEEVLASDRKKVPWTLSNGRLVPRADGSGEE